MPPFGQDFNGIFNQITLWSQWQNAGGLVPYDNTFAGQIGGYPKGALLASATAGKVWLNLADDNTVDPDGGGLIGLRWQIPSTFKAGNICMRLPAAVQTL